MRGLDAAGIGQQLAAFLPEAVNQMTPEGRLPTGDTLLENGLAALGGKLFG